MTQQQLATRLKSSQSRVAKIEAGARDVSLDLMFRGLFAVGGGLADVAGTSRKIAPSSSENGLRGATKLARGVRRSGSRV
jgi:transcriptional regulator with XRE-family HTH domain